MIKRIQDAIISPYIYHALALCFAIFGYHDKLHAQQIPPAIGTAGRSSIVLYSDGSLWGWGSQGIALRALRPELIPTPTAAAPNTTWAGLGVAVDHSLAWRSDGSLWAWGRNENGQLGDGTTVTRYEPTRVAEPAAAAPGTRWTQLAPVGRVTLALRSDSTLWAWGYGVIGLLGNGSAFPDNQLLPLPIPAPAAIPKARWIRVAASDDHALALLSDGTLWAWGVNVFRQLGTQSTEGYVAVPTLVRAPATAAAGTRWVSMAAGQYYTLALRSDGTLWSWGKNDHGELGLGTTTLETTPQQVPLPPTAAVGVTWSQVAAGQQHSLALLSDGTLWGWGRNTEGQLGTNSIGDQLRPVQEFTRGRWLQIAGGETHSLALEQGSNRVFATGGLDESRNSGQLGDGTINGSIYFRPSLAVALPTTQPVTNKPLTIYPNPAHDWVRVSGVELGTPVQIRNALGQLCRQTQLGASGIDVRQLAAGSYFLTIQPSQAPARTVRLLIK